MKLELVNEYYRYKSSYYIYHPNRDDVRDNKGYYKLFGNFIRKVKIRTKTFNRNKYSEMHIVIILNNRITLWFTR